MYQIGNVNNDFVTCTNEQQFKKLYCVSRLKRSTPVLPEQKIFCIETEETVAGFPDVMELETSNFDGCPVTTANFYEFKFSSKNGVIKFQPTQPAFYKKNPELNIKVVAYNNQSRRVHVFSVDELFDKESPYYINKRNGVYARIDLTLVEKELGI